jgi:hypothetical protein
MAFITTVHHPILPSLASLEDRFPDNGEGGGGSIGMVMKDEVSREAGWAGIAGAHLPVLRYSIQIGDSRRPEADPDLVYIRPISDMCHRRKK